MADEKKQEKPSTGAPAAWKNFVAGGVGGTFLVFVGHPLDTVKVRLQTMNATAGAPQFSGALDCFQQTLRKEGFRGLYKGVGSPLMGISFLYSICFYSYGFGKSLFADKNNPGQPLSIPAIMGAGCVAGFATTIVTVPIELVKARLQIQYATGSAEYKGVVDCAIKVYQRNGIAGLYRGVMVTLLRDVPGTAAYFAGYEVVRRALVKEGQGLESVSKWGLLLAGGMAGWANWLAIFPIDVVKSRLQTQPDTQPPRYTGTLDCFRKIYRAEGIRGLFAGLTPTMVRSFPANAACFFGYELAMDLLGR